MIDELLPFVITRAVDDRQLLDACSVRVAGYGHHFPQLRAALAFPDDADCKDDTSVFVAYDKRHGTPVGTMRIQICHPEKPLLLESCVDLPQAFDRQSRAEITRLALSPGVDQRIKWALWKVGYSVCVDRGVRYLFIAARARGLVRQYTALGAIPVFGNEQMVALTYAANIPHHVLVFDIHAAERAWFHAQHRLYDFMFVKHHPDLHVPASQSIRSHCRSSTSLPAQAS